jgi:hypothetical protein
MICFPLFSKHPSRSGWPAGSARGEMADVRDEPQSEQNESGLLHLADMERTFRDFRVGPILLQKDFAHLTAQD